jgi:hypothetical protein
MQEYYRWHALSAMVKSQPALGRKTPFQVPPRCLDIAGLPRTEFWLLISIFCFLLSAFRPNVRPAIYAQAH